VPDLVCNTVAGCPAQQWGHSRCTGEELPGIQSQGHKQGRHQLTPLMVISPGTEGLMDMGAGKAGMLPGALGRCQDQHIGFSIKKNVLAT
jgi:hypothetical protein